MGTLETIRGGEIQNNGSVDVDTLYFLGGVALCVVGAGLVLTNPVVKQFLSRVGVGGAASLVQESMPDLERYLRMRSM